MFLFLRCCCPAAVPLPVESQVNAALLLYQSNTSNNICCSLFGKIFIPPPNEVGGGLYWIHLVRPSVRLSVCPSVCRRHGFRSISQVWFGISISNFICMLMVAIGRSLLIFSDVTFKMSAWWPYWIFWFPDSNFTLAWMSTSNFSGTILMYIGRSLLIFSNVNFKMAARQPY